MYFFDTSCYLFETDKVNQPSASQSCQERGFHLVYINSNAEQDYLTQTVARSVGVKTDYWIGLTKNGSSSPQWLDGTVLPYTNWFQGTNTECAIMWQNRGFTWATRNCESALNSICEFEIGDGCNEYRPHEFGSSCYQLVEAKGSLSAARSICAPEGHLVYIESAEEQAFLQSVVTNSSLPSNANVWIGLEHDEYGLWTWMNGEDLPQWAGDAFTSDSPCFRMRSNSEFEWSDRPCRNNHAYICEQDLGNAHGKCNRLR
ncbi:C-type mannose receptor 2-like [Diadema setosum]|uniref:C-type mannose receptor 2-like n=1 Tax=Diadema setosum TaxID=31175 RepID=UPI003B3A5F23